MARPRNYRIDYLRNPNVDQQHSIRIFAPNGRELFKTSESYRRKCDPDLMLAHLLEALRCLRYRFTHTVLPVDEKK